MTLWNALALAATVSAQGFPSTCPFAPSMGPNDTIGTCPTSFTIIGPTLEPIHESHKPSTGLAVDPYLNLYLTYPRNTDPTQVNVALATSFTDEEPRLSAEIQNCTAGQNASECFINVQNVVLDSLNQMWIVDSGIPTGKKSAVTYDAKIVSLNLKSSLLTIDLDDRSTTRCLHNTTVTRADPTYVGVFDGEPIYSWNGTKKSYINTDADGIALASGNVYWGVLGSRRFYYISQDTLINTTLSDAEVIAAVHDPGQCGTGQAGLTADDHGRFYIMSFEHNAVFYVDTLQSEVTEEVNGVPPGGTGPVAPENYWFKTLVRSGLIQHIDSAAILDGWLHFNTNQLELSPSRQYMNVDHRKGPFRSYRMWTGRGHAA